MQENPTRRAGRDARRATRTAPNFDMLPTLRNGLPVVEPMTSNQIERIHEASMAILEDVGVIFRDPIALDDWKKAGADVRGERVHLDRGLVMELIRS
ncbi:MAG: trimethylamine methyltransferase, partial [Rhodospirillaceae bacterium]